MAGFEPRYVVDAVRAALGGKRKAILHGHLPVDATEIGLRIAQGPTDVRWVTQFEDAIRRRVGVKHAVATASGTAALELALAALDLGGAIIPVPVMSFVAAIEAVIRSGSVPQFYDMPDELEGEYSAVVSVDMLGIPQNFRRARIDAPVIEDAAQALGSIGSDGSAAGTNVRIGVLSFNLNKVVTTGGGGMLLTDDDGIAKQARYLSAHGKVPSPFYYDHSEVGFNHRMPVPAAILGLASLGNLDATLKAKAVLHQRYRVAFREVPDVTFVEAPEEVTWNHWMNAIEVPEGQRDATLQALAAAGYECRALFTPLHMVGPYVRYAGGRSFEEAEWRFARTICLPSGPELAA